MAGFFNQFLKQIATGDEIHDWQHASRTFVDSLYRLSPKIGTVYHVFMDLNPVVAQVEQNEQIEIGMMAKQIALPRFSVTHKTYNAYNRKNIACAAGNSCRITSGIWLCFLRNGCYLLLQDLPADGLH